MNSTVKTYIAAAKAYSKYLVSHPDAFNKLQLLLNQRGHEYFGKDRSPYKNIEFDNDSIEVLNKSNFTKVYTEQTGEEEIWQNEAAFDDSYRHTIFVNIEDMDNPRLVDVRPDFISRATDWILTWDKVQQLPTLFPDGTVIAVHVDQYVPFIPIPTIKLGGGGKRRTRRRRRRRRSTRIKN
jgi:hypothetical protein